jgi:hypothetical protein
MGVENRQETDKRRSHRRVLVNKNE